MADVQVPLNRVGVVRAQFVSKSGDVTDRGADQVFWCVLGGGDQYFSISASSDGKSAEIKPIATGSGILRLEFSSDAGTFHQDRTVEIVGNASDGPSGELPVYVGMKFSVVRDVSQAC